MSREKEGKRARRGEEELGGAVRYTTWYAVTLRRGYAAVSGYGPRHDAARCAMPWCCRLTYLSAAAPPATGSAASVQSGVLPICIPDSPPGRSNDSPVYPFSLYRASLRFLRPRRSHAFLSSRLSSSSPAALSVFASAITVRAMPLKRPRRLLVPPLGRSRR